MNKKVITLFLLFLSLNHLLFAQEAKVTKITEKVIVVNLPIMSNCNIVAISTEKGIVLIDTEASPKAMTILKEAIQREFPYKEFAYVINTHAHSHHVGGNAVFKGLPIIAHENITKDMKWWFEVMENKEERKQWSEHFKKEASKCKEELKSHSKESAEAMNLKKKIKFWEELEQEKLKGYEIIVPDIRFSDKMTLQLGDITLNLIYFGKGHSESDILIHIPEEKVLVSGAVIRDQAIPSAFTYHEVNRDISRWLSVLKDLMGKIDDIEHIIPGHANLLNGEFLKSTYNYYSELLEKTSKLRKEGFTLEEIKEKLSLDNEFSHFNKSGNIEEKMKERHQENIEAFWNYLNDSSELND